MLVKVQVTTVYPFHVVAPVTKEEAEKAKAAALNGDVIPGLEDIRSLNDDQVRQYQEWIAAGDEFRDALGAPRLPR